MTFSLTLEGLTGKNSTFGHKYGAGKSLLLEVITGTILSIWINGSIGQEKINIPRCSVVLASM